MQYGRTTMPADVFNVVMITGFIMAALILVALYLLSRSGKKSVGKKPSKGAAFAKKLKKGKHK